MAWPIGEPPSTTASPHLPNHAIHISITFLFCSGSAFAICSSEEIGDRYKSIYLFILFSLFCPSPQVKYHNSGILAVKVSRQTAQPLRQATVQGIPAGIP